MYADMMATPEMQDGMIEIFQSPEMKDTINKIVNEK